MVSYNQHKLTLDEDKSLEKVLSKINDLKGQVVVNIVNNPKEAPVFFSLENLEAALSIKKKALVLETLPEEQYRNLMLNEIQMVGESLVKLRTLFKDHFFADVKEVAKRFIIQYQNAVILLSCYALQKSESGIAKRMDALKSVFKHLEANYCVFRDNVRFMDDLQYQVAPLLQAITKEMQDK